MSIFSNPVSAIGIDDLEHLLESEVVENVRLEFKRERPSKSETLKKISSLANTYGGMLIVGADADNSGRLQSLPGIEEQANYKQTIVQWCADGISPWLDVDVSDAIPTPDDETRFCYVVAVQESQLAPHFLNGRKGVYVRTNEFSERFDAKFANEHEIRHLLDRRNLVNKRRERLIDRSKARFRTFKDRRYGEYGRNAQIGATLELFLGRPYPGNPICSEQELLRKVRTATIPWRQLGFPRDRGGIISQHESAIALRPGSTFSLFEANTWGILYYAAEIEWHEEDLPHGIHLNQFLGHLLVFLEHARKIFYEVGYQGPILTQVGLENILEIPWIYFPERNQPAQGPRSELDDAVEFVLETTTQDLEEIRDRVSKELLRSIFFALNWDEQNNDPELINQLIHQGYEFNFWE